MPETGNAGPQTPLAIIAGRGALPREIAERRAAAGLPYTLFVFPECFEPWMAEHPVERHEFEKIGALFRAFSRAGITHVVFAGAMNRPRVRLWRADLKAVGVAARALPLVRKGDDALLRGVAAIFESEGLIMLGPQDILGASMTIGAGPLGRCLPNDRDRADAAHAARIVNALGALDIGQGAVVSDGICLAVEAIEGTDLMLSRLAGLPPERRASAPPPFGVLYKGPKPDQDRRLDLPAIGPATVRGVAAAGLRGLVVAAGETALIDALETRRTADAAGVFVYGARVDELSAWG